MVARWHLAKAISSYICAKPFSLTKNEGKLFLVPKSSGPLLERLPLINKHCNNALINSSSAQETAGHLLTLSVSGVRYSQFYCGSGTGH